MNRVGQAGRGESTWLGFFLHGVLTDFAGLCDARDDGARAARYRAEARRLGVAARADVGRRVVSVAGTTTTARRSDRRRTTSAEIDSIAQIVGRAVGRGAAALRRARDGCRAHGARSPRRSQLLLLLDPPFDHSAQEPGYIKGYPPGIRENGGQYTHAAVWVVMALARLGSGDEATELFHMLNPINHTRTAADVERYKAEPYVIAGDVYARPPHAGRGGWSWYTGSAAWMYRAGLESMLGLRRRGATFSVDPCIPSSWPGYEITWRFQSTRYQISVVNPDSSMPRRARGDPRWRGDRRRRDSPRR